MRFSVVLCYAQWSLVPSLAWIMTIYEYNSEIIQFTTWGPYLREKIIRRREREWYFTGSLWAEAQQWHDFLFLRVFADINFPIFQWDSDPIGTVQWQHQQPDGSQPYRDILKLKFGFSKKIENPIEFHHICRLFFLNCLNLIFVLCAGISIPPSQTYW